MIKKLMALSLISACMISCAHVQKKTSQSVDIGAGVSLALKEPSEILPDIQLVQLLKIEHKKGTNTAQVILTVKENKMTILSLLPFGGELFRVEYAQGVITSRSLPVMNSQMDLKYALADIIMVYADIKTLQSWLTAGTEVQEKDNVRTISFKNQTLVEIKYSLPEKFKAAIEYRHLKRDYKITITPLSQGAP